MQTFTFGGPAGGWGIGLKSNEMFRDFGVVGNPVDMRKALGQNQPIDDYYFDNDSPFVGNVMIHPEDTMNPGLIAAIIRKLSEDETGYWKMQVRNGKKIVVSRSPFKQSGTLRLVIAGKLPLNVKLDDLQFIEEMYRDLTNGQQAALKHFCSSTLGYKQRFLHRKSSRNNNERGRRSRVYNSKTRKHQGKRKCSSRSTYVKRVPPGAR